MIWVKNIIYKIKKWFADIKLSYKIVIFSGFILIFSVLSSTMIYQNISNNIISDKVSEVSLQTLHSINSNVESLIRNAASLSRVIISSDEVQQVLRAEIDSDAQENVSGEYEDQDITNQETINEDMMVMYISKFIEFPYISSIYIFDYESNRYGVDRMPLKSLETDSIVEAFWYSEVLANNGSYILKLNAGDIFLDTTGERYISLIRIINDIYTQKPLGVLVVNISLESFADSLQDDLRNYDTDIMIIDEDGNILVPFSSGLGDYDETEYINNLGKESEIIEIENTEFLISSLDIPEYNWNIISKMKFEELSKESQALNITALITVAFNSILLFLGSIVISRMISGPVNRLLNAMKSVENGVFEQVDVPIGNDEIGKLKNGYNIMIAQIQELIDEVIDDQKRLRKLELDVLQAQIKPHFLYNTFDVISSLAMQKKNDEVYSMVKTLGSYYRSSLSKGSEVITIAKEIDVVKKYLTIQKARYEDVFRVHYDLDEEFFDNQILKLVLQPIVENALYHGIKPLGEMGNIYISLKGDDANIILSVEDDGVGMDEEFVKELLSDDGNGAKSSSFGLRGTIERLVIFYGTDSPVDIESKKDVGTKITIKIPMVLEDKDGK